MTLRETREVGRVLVTRWSHLCRIATAAALTVWSSCSPERKKVIKLDRVSFGHKPTFPCFWNTDFTV